MGLNFDSDRLKYFNYYHPLLGGRGGFHLSEEQRAACDEAPSVSEGEALAEAVKPDGLRHRAAGRRLL